MSEAWRDWDSLWFGFAVIVVVVVVVIDFNQLRTQIAVGRLSDNPSSPAKGRREIRNRLQLLKFYFQLSNVET